MKRKKRIINNPILIYLFLFLLCLFAYGYYVSLDSLRTKDIVFEIMFLIYIISTLLFSFICVNWFSTIVVYNGKTIRRRGFFFGLRIKINIEDIKDVCLIENGPFKYYELIVDLQSAYFIFERKKNIRLAYNKKSKKFIDLFWDKNISERANPVF